MANYASNDELMHYGVLGMKWGRRKATSNAPSGRSTRSTKSTASEADQAAAKEARKAKAKKAVKIGAAAAGTALAAYGTYKMSKLLKDKAATKSYENGKKVAEQYFKEMKKYDGVSVPRKLSAWSAYKGTLQNTDKRTQKVKKSTVEAIKYLRHPERYQVDGGLIQWY